MSDNELPNLEEVTPKMAQASLIEEATQIPLPAVTSDDDEFHEASESHELDSVWKFIFFLLHFIHNIKVSHCFTE